MRLIILPLVFLIGEIDTSERGQDGGTRATQALSERVFRKDVRVVVTDVDRYNRLIGKIWLDDKDVNREMVCAGHAWVYRRYLDDQSLIADEAAAKSEGIGLWGIANPVLQGNDFLQGSRFHLSQCGLSRLDGDSDGVPCEAMCR